MTVVILGCSPKEFIQSWFPSEDVRRQFVLSHWTPLKNSYRINYFDS